MATGYPPLSQDPRSSEPATRVELHISCSGLMDADVFSKSDPIVSVHMKDNFGTWREVHLQFITVITAIHTCSLSSLPIFMFKLYTVILHVRSYMLYSVELLKLPLSAP